MKEKDQAELLKKDYNGIEKLARLTFFSASALPTALVLEELLSCKPFFQMFHAEHLPRYLPVLLLPHCQQSFPLSEFQLYIQWCTPAYLPGRLSSKKASCASKQT